MFLLALGARVPFAISQKLTRILQVALTDLPIAFAVCFKVKPSSSGNKTDWAIRSSSALRAAFKLVCASAMCSLPLEILAMMVSFAGKPYYSLF
jgi:hypothetical protein